MAQGKASAMRMDFGLEHDARNAEINVLVRPRREAAVGARPHDAVACPLDARVEREQLEKRGLWPQCRLFLCLGGTGSRFRTLAKGR